MGDRVILQSGPALGLGNHTFANPPSPPLPLDVDLMAQIEVSIVCTEVGLHLIRSHIYNTYTIYTPCMYKIRETTVRILDQARVHIAPMRNEDDAMIRGETGYM